MKNSITKKNPILDEARFPCLNSNIKDWNDTAISGFSHLYHATDVKNMPSIMNRGIISSMCGKVHGEMAIRPKEKTVYLSRHESSNNLNTELFKNNAEVIVLKIKVNEALLRNSYPDDGLFCAFGNEQIWEDDEELSGDLDIPIEEAEDLMKILVSAKDHELADIMKPLWSWYLLHHGEISTHQDISPEQIVSGKCYERQRDANLAQFKVNDFGKIKTDSQQLSF